VSLTPQDRPLQVLVVEDSAVVRELLVAAIGADARLQVAAAVDSGEQALRALGGLRPDVISMDICLPGLSGIEVTRRIMSEQPTPIVVVSGAVAEQSHLALEAMRAGALGVAEKPRGLRDERSLGRIRDLLVALSSVRLVRQRGSAGKTMLARTSEAAASAAACHPCHAAPRVLGIAASTGGPPAIAAVLRALGPDLALPVLAVQHIAPAFMPGFAEWLGRQVRRKVVLAREGCEAEPGVVHLPPDERHLTLVQGRIALREGRPEGGHRPSADALFRSLAEDHGPTGLGVLLTGMGEDGAEGLLALRRAGGHTIAEHESTAVVYGMPGAAARIGGACELVPLPAIAGRIRARCRRGEEA